MAKDKISPKELTDEQVLKEFVRRFQCDGAMLIYLDSGQEYGFGRWSNSRGREWVDHRFKRLKNPVMLSPNNYETEGGATVKLSELNSSSKKSTNNQPVLFTW